MTIEKVKSKLHQIIFESDTWYGRLYNIVLMSFIVISVLTVIIETVFISKSEAKVIFVTLEWFSQLYSLLSIFSAYGL